VHFNREKVYIRHVLTHVETYLRPLCCLDFP
jgi:hypothetical protein